MTPNYKPISTVKFDLPPIDSGDEPTRNLTLVKKNETEIPSKVQDKQTPIPRSPSYKMNSEKHLLSKHKVELISEGGEELITDEEELTSKSVSSKSALDGLRDNNDQEEGEV